MHVKGLEMPGYEPRSLKTMALGLATTPRWACHNRSSAYEADFSNRVDRLTVDDQRGLLAAASEDFEAVLDSLIWCKFLRRAFDDFYAESAQVYTMITGWDLTADELKLAGERINNLKKLFNLREGWTRTDDTLPPRVLEEKLPTGVVAGVGLTRHELDYMIASYYRARGWTNDGLISPDQALPARPSGANGPGPGVAAVKGAGVLLIWTQRTSLRQLRPTGRRASGTTSSSAPRTSAWGSTFCRPARRTPSFPTPKTRCTTSWRAGE